MWILIVMVVVGFLIGYFTNIPFEAIDKRYLALIFLALLDSLTYALTRDLARIKNNNVPVLIRLVFVSALGCFIIYFGDKSQVDLYYVAIIPLAIGLALNMYKFLPK